MPELPEVESIRSALDPLLTGKTVAEVTVFPGGTFHGESDQLIGDQIIGTGRIGKVLHLCLASSLYLSVHLKMSGQLVYAEDATNAVYAEPIPFAASNRLPARSTRVLVMFSDTSGLFLNDMRRFGWMKLSDKPEGPSGPDVTTDEFRFDGFQDRLQRTQRTVHQVLLDQSILAGVGNIYANDALHTAGILPTRSAASLTEDEAQKLFAAIKQTIAEGVRSKGASGKDEVFILPDGSKGSYQHLFQVYQREGQPCRRCGSVIKRSKSGGRSVFFCESCQR